MNSDPQLVVNQVNRNYDARELTMSWYLKEAKVKSAHIDLLEVEQIMTQGTGGDIGRIHFKCK